MINFKEYDINLQIEIFFIFCFMIYSEIYSYVDK